jgi:hypothetical protein
MDDSMGLGESRLDGGVRELWRLKAKLMNRRGYPLFEDL